MYHADENDTISFTKVSWNNIIILLLSYLYLKESTNKRSSNGIVQSICKLHDRVVYLPSLHDEEI
jgi:hypothetical protein